MTDQLDFVRVIDELRNAPPQRGLVLIDTRFRESAHSYRELAHEIGALAAGFASQGLQPGQTVLMSLATRLDSIASFLALIRLGAVPVSVPPPLLSQDRAAHLQRIASLYVSHRIDRFLEAPDLPGLADCLGGAGRALEVVRADDANDWPRAEVSPEDVALVQFSSGSTSLPKGVRITHRNLVQNLSWIVRNDRRTPESVVVSWLPLCHDMGLVGCMLSNLLLANDLVLMDPLCFMTRPVSWLERISRHRGTTTAVPNFALDVCTDRIDDAQLRERGIDLSSFTYLYCGSEPVSLRSIERFEDKFGAWGFPSGAVYPVYGMSEATLIITAPDREQSVVAGKIDGVEVPSVGYPLGDLELRIVDEQDTNVAPGIVGEVLVRGSSITPGYLAAEADAGGFRDGWLLTGDLGALDESGRLYITGRRKDLIILQGRNFYGHDIAASIETLPQVRKGKVFVFGFATDGEDRIVVMTAPPGRGATGPAEIEALEEAIQRVVLRDHGLPVHEVFLIRRIPKTTSGKIDRRQCVELYRRSLRGKTD